MTNGTPKGPTHPFYRCAGPNCGTLKGSSDRWWLMWTSFADLNIPVLYLCPWDEEIAQKKARYTSVAIYAPRSSSRSSWECARELDAAGRLMARVIPPYCES